MKKLILILAFLQLVVASKVFTQNFSFNVFADVNQFADEEFDKGEYFRHAIEFIRDSAAGSFAIIPGDINPPWSTMKIIRDVLGDKYKLYPAVGNHEYDESELIVWLKKYLTKLNVNPGPENSELTSYSFDYNDAHFVALNYYYDGDSDVGKDSQLNEKLLTWLAKDLNQNKKSYTFVYGHVPLISLPDYHNSRMRHKSGNLNEKDNYQRFVDILRSRNITAYICGHTHNFSYANINGIIQIDAGHCRGDGDDGASSTFLNISVNNEDVLVSVHRKINDRYIITNRLTLRDGKIK